LTSTGSNNTRDGAADRLLWADGTARAALGYTAARDALDDPRGRVVRCTPWRFTVMLDLPGARVFVKHRGRRPRAGLREWRILHRLRAAGVPVPEPVFLARSGARTALGTLAVGGRPFDALLAEASDRNAACRRIVELIAPRVARLHAAGYCHRDLYLNHWFADSLEASHVALIDVERTFRPRLRARRFRAKDLAALLASWPGDGAPATGALRFLRAVHGGELPPRWKRDARWIVARARRMRSRRPRHG